MSNAEYRNSGRLSRKRLTGLWPFGWSRVASPLASPTNDPSWRLQGDILRTSPAALRLAPPGDRKPRCGMQGHQYRRPAAGSLRSMVSAGLWPARGARRAPSLSGRGVFPAPRPHAFFATVARLRPDARVRSAQSSPGPFAALRAAASGLALASGLHLAPLVARHGAHAKQEKQKHPRPERTPNEDSGVF